MKKIAITALFVIAVPLAGSAHRLEWNIPQGKRLEIVRTAEVEYRKNSRVEKTYTERNIIDFTCQERTGDGSRVKGQFTVYSRGAGEEVFNLRERFDSEFTIAPTGRFTVPPQFIMPNIRHVPTFPAGDVSVGAKWSAPAEVLINAFKPPLMLQLDAQYFLTAVEKRGETTVGVINYYLHIDKDLVGKVTGENYPARIFGYYFATLNWDLERNLPIDSIEKYTIMFLFGSDRTGYDSLEFRMNITSQNKLYENVGKDETDRQAKDLAGKLPSGSGVTVDTHEKGLVLRLGEVLFDVNSARIREDAKGNLDVIGKLLKERYPDREIIVEGHTDNTGESPYNDKLSHDRAKSVGAHLKGRIGHNKLSFIGHGPRKPIADNRTKEGRQKNRRVEIIIKLN